MVTDTTKGLDKPPGWGISARRASGTRGGRGVCIREYRHDIDCYNVIRHAYDMHQASKYATQPFDANTIATKFLASIDGHNTQGFVADHQEHGLVGFIAITLMPYMFNDRLMAHDLALYVAPAHRHTTAFARLVIAAEEWAKDRGADAIVMGISAPQDPSLAARAYMKMGYTQVGLILRKEISQ